MPSLTICIKWFNGYQHPKQNMNLTFNEFMQSSYNIQDILLKVEFKDKGQDQSE